MTTSERAPCRRWASVDGERTTDPATPAPLPTTVEVMLDADQTRLLAQQKIDVAEGALVIGTTTDDVLVVVRLAPPQPAVRSRLEQALARIKCGNMPTS